MPRSNRLMLPLKQRRKPKRGDMGRGWERVRDLHRTRHFLCHLAAMKLSRSHPGERCVSSLVPKKSKTIECWLPRLLWFRLRCFWHRHMESLRHVQHVSHRLAKDVYALERLKRGTSRRRFPPGERQPRYVTLVPDHHWLSRQSCLISIQKSQTP